ncbi:MAG TPA: NDP-sugar synthase [Blastocatellia bacterium]|nr:NDP-sugar synthase [Blastocatellia bacterium]
MRTGERSDRLVKAMILAAGFGTRLWPLTEDRTKPAIPFLNRPLICYAVEYLKSHGIADILVNLHHHPDSIRRALGDGSQFGVTIHYSLEEDILGTSGALDRVREQLIDDDFVVINGKIVTDIDLGSAIHAHRDAGAIATLILIENAARERFSEVEVDSRGWITRFGRMPEAAAGQDGSSINASPTVPGSQRAPLMFTGIQVLSPRIFEYIPRGRTSHSVADVYPGAIEAGEVILGYTSSGAWFEMSTLDRYLEASLVFMQKEGRTLIAGRDCVIEEGAQVVESVLWDRVKIERGARVSRAVLGDDVRIPGDSVIARAVVVRRESVSKIERGVVVGENLIVPL